MLGLYWIFLNVILLVVTLTLVPWERFKQLIVYGLIGGMLFAMAIFYVANQLNLWTTVGTTKVFDIPILPSIAWFFPVVVFANFFPKNASVILKILYIIAFAFASVVVQYTFAVLGMWRNINWSIFHTFYLAIGTHILLSLYLMFTEQYLPED